LTSKKEDGMQDDLVKEQHERGMKELTEYYDNRPKSFKELYARLGKWLFLPRTHFIDVILATVISNQRVKGEPLFTFIVGPSGDGKSTIVRALKDLRGYKVKCLDRITKNTFATGMTVRRKSGKSEKVHDLGDDLADSSTILLIPDLACLTSLRSEDKKEVWATLRTLYDGDIYKDTGTGVHIAHTNCHVTIIGCSTTTLKSEILIHQHLGSRELMYEIPTKRSHNKEKMRKGRLNFRQAEEMEEDVKYLIQSFLAGKKLDMDMEVPDNIYENIEDAANKLSLLRAHAPVDYHSQYGELIEDVSPEVPVRLAKQLRLLYIALHSLDGNYDDKTFLTIMERIVYSSSNSIRYRLYEYFESNKDTMRSVSDLHESIKIGRKTISAQCEALVNIGILTKHVQEENHFGRTVDVSYYEWKGYPYKQSQF
jgi:hypothetical protein